MNSFHNFNHEEQYSVSPASLIVGSFLILICGLLIYLYLANRALMNQGLHKSKKYGKKTKKGKELWSFE